MKLRLSGLLGCKVSLLVSNSVRAENARKITQNKLKYKEPKAFWVLGCKVSVLDSNSVRAENARKISKTN